MSSNVSFIRAAASCTPFIGTLVGVYNSLETNIELQNCNSPLLRSLEGMQVGLIQLQAAMSAFSGSREGLEQAEAHAHRLQAESAKEKQKLIEVLEKGSLYFKYGITSSLLSVAAIVGLFAFGFFTMPGTILMLAAFSFNIAVHARNLYQANRSLMQLRPAPVQAQFLQKPATA